MAAVQHVLYFHISVSGDHQCIGQDQASSFVDDVSLNLLDLCRKPIGDDGSSDLLCWSELLLLKVILEVHVSNCVIHIFGRQEREALTP